MLKRVIAIIFALVLVVIYVLYPVLLNSLATADEPTFLGFSNTPRDISDFVSDLKDQSYTVRTVVTTPAIFGQNMIDPKTTLYIAVGIEQEYTPNEITAIQDFVRAGGHAIIADDFGYVKPLADKFNVTYYPGQYLEKASFDKNVNFPVCWAALGVDRGSWELDKDVPPKPGEQQKVWSDKRDGFWDDNDDKDYFNLIDEDFLEYPVGSTGIPDDNDGDENKLIKDKKDNDFDGFVDEPKEGRDEDLRDDDGDWIDEPDENGFYNGIHDPYEMGVNEERLNGKNDDDWTFLFTIDEETLDEGPLTDDIREKFEYRKIYLSEDVCTNCDRPARRAPTGKSASDYCYGDHKCSSPHYEHYTTVEQNENKTSWDIVDRKGCSGDDYNWKFTVKQEISTVIGKDGKDKKETLLWVYKRDEMIDEDIFNYRLIMNKPVGIRPIIPSSVKTRNVIARSSEDSYVDLNNNGRIELPEWESTETCDVVSTDNYRVELVVEVVDPEFVGKGSVVFIADADMFTNDLYSLDHKSINYDSINRNELLESVVNASLIDDDPLDKDEDGKFGDPNIWADNTADKKEDYDNKIFMEDLIYYLFYDELNSGKDPEDIVILIDDSRHGEDAVWLKPMYATLRVTSVLTSQFCYVLVSSIFLFVGLVVIVLLSKGQETWEHEFNVRTFKRRGMVPVTIAMKKARLKRGVLEKVRMDRGLSPEEFREVDPRDIDRLIGDPQLVQLVRDEKATYTNEDIKRIIEVINRWKK